MLFSKIRIFFLFLSFIFLIFFLQSLPFMDLSFKYLDVVCSRGPAYSFNFCLDNISINFILIVSFVTFLVLYFSQVYIEHYRNKKFLCLLLLFFISMAVLSFRGSYLTLILGWDGLGISSIFLIMFYPNKLTLYNSFLTMFFNRLGDVILILIMSYFILNFTYFYPLFFNCSPYIIFLLLFCSFTKTAQFPLSSWLPAAMSAPTPISAIVHSSTLVTAGLFLLYKVRGFMWDSSHVSIFWFSFRGLTFLLGGLLSFLEIDFKKMVAFSTMRQISMIIVICSVSLVSLSIFHMLLHAFFKTLLFCTSGLIFMRFYSEQQNFLIKITFSDKVNCILFFSSIFAITGLLFSSSFFSKDLVLEFLCSTGLTYYYLFFFLGRIFTLFYCSKILSNCFNWVVWAVYTYRKNFFSFEFIIFFIVLSIFGKRFSLLFFQRSTPLICVFDLILVLLLFFFSLIYLLSINVKSLLLFNKDISFIKTFSFSIFNSAENFIFFKDLSYRDDFFFKRPNFSLINVTQIKKRFSYFILIFLFLILLFL